MKRIKGEPRPRTEALRRARATAARIPSREVLIALLRNVPPEDRRAVFDALRPGLRFRPVERTSEQNPQ